MVGHALDRPADLPGLSAADQGIVRYVIRLSLLPASCRRAHVEALRALGLSDLEVHDVVHVACCFAYMNRLADGLGVRIEERKRASAELMYGARRTARHLAWSEGR